MFVDVVESAGTENQPIGKHAFHAPRNGIDAQIPRQALDGFPVREMQNSGPTVRRLQSTIPQ